MPSRKKETNNGPSTLTNDASLQLKDTWAHSPCVTPTVQITNHHQIKNLAESEGTKVSHVTRTEEKPQNIPTISRNNLGPSSSVALVDSQIDHKSIYSNSYIPRIPNGPTNEKIEIINYINSADPTPNTNKDLYILLNNVPDSKLPIVVNSSKKASTILIQSIYIDLLVHAQNAKNSLFSVSKENKCTNSFKCTSNSIPSMEQTNILPVPNELSSQHEPSAPNTTDPNFFGNNRRQHPLRDTSPTSKPQPPLLGKDELTGTCSIFQCRNRREGNINNNSESDLPSSGSIGRNETNHGQLQSSPLDVLSAPTPTSSSSFSTPILPHSHLGATSLQPPGPDTSPEQPNRATVPASITGPRRRHELLDYFGSAHECATFSKPGSPKYGRQPSPGSSKQQCIFFLGVASEQNYIPSPYKPDPSTNSRCRRNRG